MLDQRPGVGQKLLTWVDNRFPLTKLYKEHMSEYYAPKNFNFWYVFGSLALLVLVMDLLGLLSGRLSARTLATMRESEEEPA